jgi:hypothetical protein
MDTKWGKGVGVKAAVSLGLALGLLVAGTARPAAAETTIQPSRPGLSGRSISPVQRPQWYGSVPDHGRDGDRRWDHDRGGHDGWDRGGYHWSHRPSWSHGHAGWRPGPYYRPGQWVWNGWGWVWAPGYYGY